MQEQTDDKIFIRSSPRRLIASSPLRNPYQVTHARDKLPLPPIEQKLEKGRRERERKRESGPLDARCLPTGVKGRSNGGRDEEDGGATGLDGPRGISGGSLKKYRRRKRLVARTRSTRRIRRNSICNAIALALYGDSIINPRCGGR